MVLELLFVVYFLVSVLPVCFTALVVCFAVFDDSLMAFFDGVDVADVFDEEEEVSTELAMPNWSDHWKSPVFAMILRP